MRLIFFPVHSAKEKISKILEVTHLCFYKKQHLLFSVADDKSAYFLDELFWKHPQNRFIPHVIANSCTKHLIAITTTNSNVNQAKVIFNLTQPPYEGSCSVLYEFDDYTNQEKQAFSKKRLLKYNQLQYKISSC